MTKTKNTKRALLSSGLALLVCVSMLIGSTFAWFTDSVTSAGNKIQAGTLNIDMLVKDENGEYQSVKTNQAPIFTDDVLWEPGYTEWRNIKVSTSGNLALKYQMNIAMVGQSSILADVIDVYYAASEIAKPATRSLDGLTRLGTLSEIFGSNASGALIQDTLIPDSNTEDFATIVLKMQESAGNDYQGLSIGGFDIQILATQLTYESDSFDNQYDANLELKNSGISRVLDDGSTAFYYNEESGNYGRVRLTDLPEDLGSEYVVPAEVNDLGGALCGVDLDKLTIPAGVQYAYKSLEGATIDEVILEEGTIMVPNRMFYKVNVGSVEIPASVTTIEESAFQQAYLSELVLPANVETFGVQAFAGSTLEKITFEGSNLVFDNRPMRECANLRTVIFNCDDVTFMNSTTNGDCWISNTGSNGSGYSTIKFYVKNEKVAAKVRDAIKYENPETTPIYIEESIFVTAKNITEINNELTSYKNTMISLTDNINGNLSFTQNASGNLVIDGNGHEFNGTIDIGAQSTTTASGSITIKNINFKTTEATLNFIQSVQTNHYPLNVTVSNCTFEGTGADSNVVAVNFKSAKNLTIENCTANNVHSLLQNTSGWDLTVNNVTVTNSGRGLALGTVQGVTLTKVTVDVAKYGIRVDASYNNNAVITDCNVKAFIPFVVRKITVDSNITFNGTNTMVETNTDGYWFVAGASEYEANGALPGAVAKTVTVTVNDLKLNTAGIYNNTGK